MKMESSSKKIVVKLEKKGRERATGCRDVIIIVIIIIITSINII